MLGRDFRILMVASGLCLTAWSLIVPMFEAPDEYAHWQYARHLHDHWRLPGYSVHFPEGNSPPLYYAVVAPVAWRTPGPPPMGWFNGRDEFIHPSGGRLYMNAPGDFGRYGSLRLVRFLSVLMSLATVWFCGRAAFEVTGRQSTALLAGGFAAFLPQFSFRGSNISNDVLVTTMAAWLLFLLMRLVRHGFTWRIGVLASVALAGAYLSKINAICLIPPVALAILLDPVPWRKRLTHLSVLGVALLLVAPWSIRNIVLYGDPFASGHMYEAVSGMIYERSWFDVHHVTTLPRELFKSFVAMFGYVSVKLPKWGYAIYLAVMLFAMSGLIGVLRRFKSDGAAVRAVFVTLAIIACNYLVVLRINTQFDQPQGRYMFPSLPAVMLALALGLEQWKPWRHVALRWPARATVTAWATANLFILAVVIVPVYYPPLVPALSTAVTTVSPTTIRDLSLATPAATYTLAGAQPELTVETHVAASDARFVIFDIEGRAPQPEMRGAVILTLSSPHASTRDVTLPLPWLADGKRRTIYLTTLWEPNWQGTVVRVRIKPMESAPAVTPDITLGVGRISIAGSIPAYVY
jgi:hypothetical protein